MTRTPIPSIRKARAIEDVVNYQFIGLESFATPYHGAYSFLAFFYLFVIGTRILDPVKKVPLACIWVEGS